MTHVLRPLFNFDFLLSTSDRVAAIYRFSPGFCRILKKSLQLCEHLLFITKVWTLIMNPSVDQSHVSTEKNTTPVDICFSVEKRIQVKQLFHDKYFFSVLFLTKLKLSKKIWNLNQRENHSRDSFCSVRSELTKRLKSNLSPDR